MTAEQKLEKLGNQCGEGRVVITSDTIGGNPRIAGRRISAASLVAQVANYGNVEAAAADYGVSPDDVKSALVFAYKFIDAIFGDDELQAVLEETDEPEGYDLLRQLGENRGDPDRFIPDRKY